MVRNIPARLVLACWVGLCVTMFLINRWMEREGPERTFLRITIWRFAWIFFGFKAVFLAPVLLALEDWAVGAWEWVFGALD